jgi:hypothetical protein
LKTIRSMIAATSRARRLNCWSAVNRGSIGGKCPQVLADARRIELVSHERADTLFGVSDEGCG